MNLRKHAERNLKKIAKTLPDSWGVKNNETAFSSSIDTLNQHPLAGLQSYTQYVRKQSFPWRCRGSIYKEFYTWCQLCHGRKGTQLHHLTYKRLGQEDYADVVLVCGTCHKVEEAKKRMWDRMNNL
jgi:hypothetical protein